MATALSRPFEDGRTRLLSGRMALFVACVVLLSTPHVVAAAPAIDLPAVVLGHIDGYQPAPAGVGVSGPLTGDQLATYTSDPEMKRKLAAADLPTYARTFQRSGGRRAVVIGFDLGLVANARSFVAGARESATDLGAVLPVAGTDNAFHVAVAPERASGTSIHEGFLQSGPLVFIVAISDKLSSPVSDADAIQLLRAQAAAVPAEVAAQKDPSEGALTAEARSVGYAIGLTLPIALIVGVVVVARRRRR